MRPALYDIVVSLRAMQPALYISFITNSLLIPLKCAANLNTENIFLYSINFKIINARHLLSLARLNLIELRPYLYRMILIPSLSIDIL